MKFGETAQISKREAIKGIITLLVYIVTFLIGFYLGYTYLGGV